LISPPFEYILTVDTSAGSIDVQDAKSALESLGINIRRDEIFSFLSTAEDSLDLPLFSQIAAIKIEQKERSTTAFRLFDQDGKGVICFQDLQRVTLELGEDFTDEMLQEMVDEADRSSEGLITENDFYRIITKINL
jgi:Ca2+-binding EF-hand superfamily protein